MEGVGVGEITVRFDKGLISREMVETLQELDVFFLLEVPRYHWLEELATSGTTPAKAKTSLQRDEFWSGTGSIWSPMRSGSRPTC